MVVALAVVWCGPVPGQEIPPAQRLADVRDDLAERVSEGLVPGLSVALVHEGELVWAEGLGLADRERGIAATSETVYRIGNLSQLATALVFITRSGQAVPAARGMSRTALIAEPGGPDGSVAVPYVRDAVGRFVAVGPYATSMPGATGLFSSARDLARLGGVWVEGGMLDGVRILGLEHVRTMVRGAGPLGGVRWYSRTWSHVSHRHALRPSRTPGVDGLVSIVPGTGLVLAVLANARFDVESLNEEILASWFGREPGRRPAWGRGGRAMPGLELLRGEWVGVLDDRDGPIDLQLDVEGHDEPLRPVLRFGDGGPRVAEARVLSQRMIFLACRARLGAPPGFHGIPRLVFQLEREGDQLIGFCYADAEGYFRLPFRVRLELQRK